MNTINDLKKVLKKSTPEGINGARKSLYQRLCGDKYCYYNDIVLFFDDYVSELTNTGNPFSQAQLNLLAKVAGKVLEIEDRGDLKEDVDRILSRVGHGESFRQGDFEQIRRVDVLMCLFRMSGLEFANVE